MIVRWQATLGRLPIGREASEMSRSGSDLMRSYLIRAIKRARDWPSPLALKRPTSRHVRALILIFDFRNLSGREKEGMADSVALYELEAVFEKLRAGAPLSKEVWVEDGPLVGR